MKIGTLVVLGSLPFLDKMGELLVGWTRGNTTLQIIIVMFVLPPLRDLCLILDITVGFKYVTIFNC